MSYLFITGTAGLFRARPVEAGTLRYEYEIRAASPLLRLSVTFTAAPGQRLRRLRLTWGTHCVQTPQLQRFKQAVVNAVRAARDFGFADESHQIAVMAGVPFNVPGSTNILRVAPCDERLIYRTDPD